MLVVVMPTIASVGFSGCLSPLADWGFPGPTRTRDHHITPSEGRACAPQTDGPCPATAGA